MPRTQRTPGARLVLTLVLAACLALVLLHAGAPAARAQVPLPGLAGEPENPAEAPAEDATSVAEALRLLAIVLESPEARAALVAELRAAEQAIPGAPPDAAAAVEPEAAVPETVPELIAEQALDALGDAYRSVLEVLRTLVGVGGFLANAQNVDWRAAGATALPAAALVLVTAAALMVARLVAQPAVHRLDASTVAAGLGGRVLWRTLGIVIELAAVVVALLVGMVFAGVSGPPGIGVAGARFLEAFLVTELARAAFRVAFRPRNPALRLVTMTDGLATHLDFWVARIVGLLGYGLLFAVPVLGALGSQAFAEWLELVIVVVATVVATLIVLRNRRRVREALLDRVSRLPEDAIASGLAALARVWHLIALGYIAALFVAWYTSEGDMTREMRATGWSALAVLVGSVLAAVLTRRAAVGVKVPEATRQRLPLLEQRLNSVLPPLLNALRFVVAAVVIAVILSIWGIVDFRGWANTQAGGAIVRSIGWVAGILLAAGVAWILVASWVEYRLNRETGGPPTARERTLLALFSNGFVIVLLLVTVMAVLRELGINVGPLIAGAGVLGLAIGFGAQKLVQDIINGAFIQFENTMNEGDVVTAGPITGAVEKLTIRSVSLRDINGVVHMIPFSSVDTVSNFTKTFSFHVADIRVAYREDVGEVKEAMQDAFDRLMESVNRVHILPPFEMFGVDALTENAVIVRGRIKTLPGQQWTVGRAYNELIKAVFDERGIEIPFPHRTLYMGEDRAGNAPTLTLRHLRDDGRPGTGTAEPAAPPPSGVPQGPAAARTE